MGERWSRLREAHHNYVNVGYLPDQDSLKRVDEPSQMYSVFLNAARKAAHYNDTLVFLELMALSSVSPIGLLGNLLAQVPTSSELSVNPLPQAKEGWGVDVANVFRTLHEKGLNPTGLGVTITYSDWAKSVSLQADPWDRSTGGCRKPDEVLSRIMAVSSYVHPEDESILTAMMCTSLLSPGGLVPLLIQGLKPFLAAHAISDSSLVTEPVSEKPKEKIQATPAISLARDLTHEISAQIVGSVSSEDLNQMVAQQGVDADKALLKLQLLTAQHPEIMSAAHELLVRFLPLAVTLSELKRIENK